MRFKYLYLVGNGTYDQVLKAVLAASTASLNSLYVVYLVIPTTSSVNGDFLSNATPPVEVFHTPFT